MPVIDATHDFDTLQLTFVAEFAAPVERVWNVYADPRQLERIWGPPSHPATFVNHSLTVGSRSTYYLTSPDGDKFYGYWLIQQVEEPTRFSFNDGFADADFNADPNMPESKNEFRFEAIDTGTRATYTGTYANKEGLEKVLSMGVIEGATSAISQIDELLKA